MTCWCGQSANGFTITTGSLASLEVRHDSKLCILPAGEVRARRFLAAAERERLGVQPDAWEVGHGW